jgi:hypothetical protein
MQLQKIGYKPLEYDCHKILNWPRIFRHVVKQTLVSGWRTGAFTLRISELRTSKTISLRRDLWAKPSSAMALVNPFGHVKTGTTEAMKHVVYALEGITSVTLREMDEAKRVLSNPKCAA